MKLAFKTGLAAMACAVLVACGGGDGTPTSIQAVPAGTALTINATTGSAIAQALSGQSLTFPSGIPALGISGQSTMKFAASSTGTPTFQITSSAGTVSGDLGFGSCKFTVTDSPFTDPNHPLFKGKTAIIDPCAVTFTANVTATGNTTSAPIQFVIADTSSATASISVAIAPSGTVTLTTSAGIPIAVPGTTISVKTVTGTGV